MENYQVKQKAGLGSFLVLSKQSGAMTQLAGMLTAIGGSKLALDDYFPGGVVAGAMFISPIIFASYVNNPQTFKELFYALKQTPQNAVKTKVVIRMAQDSIRQYAEERMKHYPVLPGETP
jgi:hypothetical protein